MTLDQVEETEQSLLVAQLQGPEGRCVSRADVDVVLAIS